MPTRKEIQELVKKCSWKWTTYNGVKGQLVTGPNGNSIFLPAAGYRGGTSVYFVGNFGYYWSAAQYEDSSGVAYGLGFHSGGALPNHRDCGCTVRPVSD